MARQSMKSMLQGVEYIGRPALIANNTCRYQNARNENVVRLHDTDIVTVRADGSTVLNTNGWKTVTTADRIRRYSKARLISIRGVWYLEDGDKRVPFEDGIVIGPNGELPDVPKSVADEQAALGKAINKFVALVGKDGAALPQPSLGDCWYCALRDKSGRTMGEDDPHHLRDHIETGYLHGSLIVNAMRWAGYKDTSIGILLQGLGAPKHTSIKSALRRYLRRKLGLAS
jgi:hypothetical protein